MASAQGRTGKQTITRAQIVEGRCVYVMTTSRNQCRTVDEYVARFPKDVKDILEELRHVVNESAPQAEETMSYGIPRSISMVRTWYFLQHGKTMLAFTRSIHLSLKLSRTSWLLSSWQKVLSNFRSISLFLLTW